MNKKFYIAGGCSFTFGHELSDDVDGKTPSKKSWAYQLFDQTRYPGAKIDYITAAHPGTGNPGIARRVFNAVSQNDNELQNAIDRVVVMWSFNSRYDWAMPRHRDLEGTRWATISPWDTSITADERHHALAGSEAHQEQWKRRQDLIYPQYVI